MNYASKCKYIFCLSLTINQNAINQILIKYLYRYFISFHMINASFAWKPKYVILAISPFLKHKGNF